jgi:hypothetical protein
MPRDKLIYSSSLPVVCTRLARQLVCICTITVLVCMCQFLQSPPPPSSTQLPGQSSNVMHTLHTTSIDDAPPIKNMVHFAEARSDRFGSVAHDMLLAHAHAFSQNLSFGGACPQVRKGKGLVQQARRRCFDRNVQALDMTKILHYGCPPQNDDGSRNIITLLRANYLGRELQLFTPEWRQNVRAAFGMTPSWSDTEQNHVVAAAANNLYNIVVHIRRGDADPCYTGKYGGRYLSNNHYLRLTDHYVSTAPRPDNDGDGARTVVQVTIYSESASFESFDVFLNRGFIVRLDASLVECWNHMSRADVLILSRSSFSYVPGILSSGIVVYTPFVKDPLPHWHVVSEALMNETKTELDEISKAACARPNVGLKLQYSIAIMGSYLQC